MLWMRSCVTGDPAEDMSSAMCLIVILEVIALVLNDVEQRRGSFVFETEGRLPKTDMIKVLILHLPCGDCTVF